jgi:hypothetical protein
LKLAKLKDRRFPRVRLSHKDAQPVSVTICHFFNTAGQRARLVPGFKKQFVKLDGQAPTGGSKVKQFHLVLNHHRVRKRVDKGFNHLLERAQSFGTGFVCHGNLGVHYNRARYARECDPGTTPGSSRTSGKPKISIIASQPQSARRVDEFRLSVISNHSIIPLGFEGDYEAKSFCHASPARAGAGIAFERL